ncbi:MAG: nuclear transport factor 2 family protein [Anaerolineaceae bacterium]
MNDAESLEFIRRYFDVVFGKHDPDVLDEYLAEDYFDDDIGDPHEDHIQNSKEYLKEMFRQSPTLGVDVHKAVTQDDVISAYLDWYVRENDEKRVIMKGVAIFVMRGQKIVKRHTFLYFHE